MTEQTTIEGQVAAVFAEHRLTGNWLNDTQLCRCGEWVAMGEYWRADVGDPFAAHLAAALAAAGVRTAEQVAGMEAKIARLVDALDDPPPTSNEDEILTLQERVSACRDSENTAWREVERLREELAEAREAEGDDAALLARAERAEAELAEARARIAAAWDVVEKSAVGWTLPRDVVFAIQAQLVGIGRPLARPEGGSDAATLATVKAEALREAADALDALGRGCGPEYAAWLRERADRIGGGA